MNITYCPADKKAGVIYGWLLTVVYDPDWGFVDCPFCVLSEEDAKKYPLAFLPQKEIDGIVQGVYKLVCTEIPLHI